MKLKDANIIRKGSRITDKHGTVWFIDRVHRDKSVTAWRSSKGSEVGVTEIRFTRGEVRRLFVSVDNSEV